MQVYNAMTTGARGYRATQYSVGQMLLDPTNQLSTAADHHRHQHWTPHQKQSRGSLAAQQQQHALSSVLTRPPERPVARLETPFLVPSTAEEEHGQVDLVVFAEGLVQFHGKWLLYYGQADQTVGVAVADVQP